MDPAQGKEDNSRSEGRHKQGWEAGLAAVRVGGWVVGSPQQSLGGTQQDMWPVQQGWDTLSKNLEKCMAMPTLALVSRRIYWDPELEAIREKITG